MFRKLANLFGKPSVKLNVIISQEDEEWVAHCLQMDIVTTNSDREAVLDDIVDLIEAQVMYALENENMDNIFKPAPVEEWGKLSSCKRGGTRKIIIKTPKHDHGSQSIPITEVELCVA